MAYTSVIPVRRLDRAVKYVMNIEKTTAVSLQDALDYAANRDKTEQSCFESSYACTLETAFADMRQTKERWHNSGGVQGYHLVQSFAAGEVSPELAHQIAKELADRVLGGRYEYRRPQTTVISLLIMRGCILRNRYRPFRRNPLPAYHPLLCHISVSF